MKRTYGSNISNVIVTLSKVSPRPGFEYQTSSPLFVILKKKKKHIPIRETIPAALH